MQIIANIFLLHPLVAELSIVFVALIVALFLSVWGGKKLFASLAVKSRRGASVAAFAWYAVLFFYFSIITFTLQHAALIDLGFSQYLDRLYSAAENYPTILFFVFLICGAAILIVSIKKQTASISASSSVSFVRALWSGTRGAFLVAIVIFLVLVITRIPAVQEKKLTEEAVNKIHSQKITMADVLGNNLPPEPDPRLKDHTVEGIDANNNGIRDDVELAIFKLHPDSQRIRAAELQYAMALQNELTNVFNSETLVATIQQESRGSVCILDLKLSKDIESLVFNTDIRKKIREDIFNKFMTSYSLPNSSYCDIDPKIFTN